MWVHATDPVSLDPILTSDSPSTNVTSQIFEGLVRFDPSVPNIQLEPLLAESFGQLDPYTWYFNLHSGVYFHDGAYFNAHAVTQNFSRIFNPNNNVPQIFILDMISEVIAIDDYTVHIITEFPFAPLAGHLANRVAFMVSPYAIAEEEAGGILVSENAIGTGPFKFHSRSHGNYILLERFDDYWGSTALPATVEFRVIPEPAIRLAMLEAGEAHGLEGMPTDYQIALGIPSIDVFTMETTQIDFIGFNTMPTHPYLSDIRVRQAISMAINRQQIIDYLAEGLGTLAEGPLSNMVAFAPQNAQHLPYDIEQARTLLEEAGLAEGFTLNFWTNEGNSFREQVGVFVQSALSHLNITVNLQTQPWATYLENTDQGLHDMYMLGWITTTGDADYGLHPLFHSSQHGPAGNRTFFTNEALDELLDRGRVSTDSQERYEIYAQAVDIINHYAPKVFIRFVEQVIVTYNIDGLDVDFSVTPWFQNVTIR